MPMTWDWVIAVLIIVGLILAIWAKISQQTIKELLADLVDLVREKKEDNLDSGYIPYYE